MNRLFIIRQGDQFQGVTAFIRMNWKAAADKGKPLAIQITEAKTKRSIEQNKRLHVLLAEIADQAWVGGRQYSVEAWKEHFRREYIGIEEIELPNGKRMEQGIGTSTLDVAEFGELMTKIEAYAVTELGVRFDEAFAA